MTAQKKPPIVINRKHTTQTVEEEYKIITQSEGVRNKNWALVKQSVANHNNRWIDTLEIKTNENSTLYYFDVTASLPEQNVRPFNTITLGYLSQ